MRPVALLLPASLHLHDELLLDLHSAVAERCGLPLAPVRVRYAELLPEILPPDALAWAPSWIAFLLKRIRLASPLLGAALEPRLGPRSSVLLARYDVKGLPSLAGRRMGWVSRSSATGFVVPRLYLESFRFDLDALFAGQRFCGSHEAAADALVGRQVDAIATDSRRLGAVLERARVRVLASVGPLPSDVLVAGAQVPLGIRERIARGMRGLSVGPIAFDPVSDGHLDLFELLVDKVAATRPTRFAVRGASMRGRAAKLGSP
jgi:hypothetical protein